MREIFLRDEAAVGGHVGRQSDPRSIRCRTRPAHRSAIARSVFARSGSTRRSPAVHSPPPGLPYASTDAGNLRHRPVELRRSGCGRAPAVRVKPCSASCTAGMHDVLPRKLAEALVRERKAAHGAGDARRQVSLVASARCRPSRRACTSSASMSAAPSRDSRRWWRCRSAARTTMKPPPPMLPALGCVTASAKAVATAASTAEPPFARIDRAGVAGGRRGADDEAVLRGHPGVGLGLAARLERRHERCGEDGSESTGRSSHGESLYDSPVLRSCRAQDLLERSLACRSGQVSRSRSARPSTGAAPISRCFPRLATRVELCLFDDDGDRNARAVAGGDRALLARLLPRGRRRASGTAIASTGPGRPTTGTGATRRSCCIDPYAKAIDGGWNWNEAMFPYHFDNPDRSRNDLDSAPFMPRSVVIDPAFDWGDDRLLRTPVHQTIIYETHVKGFTKRHPGLPEEHPRHLCGDGASGRRRVSAEARGHGGRAAAGPPVRPGLPPRRTGPAELLGLQLDRLPGAPQRVLLVGRRRAAGARIQDAREGAARRRHRGHPRRRLQPHGRRQPSRSGAVVQGHRQRGVLPAGERQPPVLHGLHRHGQHAEHAASARAAAADGQSALLGDRDARRRVPVRPRGRARARTARRRTGSRRFST